MAYHVYISNLALANELPPSASAARIGPLMPRDPHPVSSAEPALHTTTVSSCPTRPRPQAPAPDAPAALIFAVGIRAAPPKCPPAPAPSTPAIRSQKKNVGAPSRPGTPVSSHARATFELTYTGAQIHHKKREGRGHTAGAVDRHHQRAKAPWGPRKKKRTAHPPETQVYPPARSRRRPEDTKPLLGQGPSFFFWTGE
ncbi:hypothetical protein B0J12DRAFT_250781 [Macrophomina phaseolina]|uniref:Uncharacterized protein n=1 Tax=Macrophomina phaseolina TaxID=35725 RepID=A0ABQ8FZM3_9PEZI|nr:hypothetical protein B0J12DRAFT_250781 [Macrophomina phaseolina]